MSKLQGIYADEERKSFKFQSTSRNKLRRIEVGEFTWVVGPELPNKKAMTDLPQVEGIHYPVKMKLASTSADLWGVKRTFSRNEILKDEFPKYRRDLGAGSSTLKFIIGLIRFSTFFSLLQDTNSICCFPFRSRGSVVLTKIHAGPTVPFRTLSQRSFFETDPLTFFGLFLVTLHFAAVMILDGGIIEHSQLPFVRQIDVTDSNVPIPEFVDHGTEMTSIMASKEFGLAQGADYIMVKVHAANSATSFHFLDGVSKVLEEKKLHPKKRIVVNMSMSTDPLAKCDHDMMLAVAQLRKQDIFVIVAAGNGNANACFESPGCSEDAFTVAAITQQNRLLDLGEVGGSNWGACVDLCAPGDNVRAYGANGETKTTSGTSASTAFVTGVAAILAGKGHGAEEIRKMLVEHSTKGLLENVLHKVYNRVLYMNPDGTLPERQFYQDKIPRGPRKAKLPAGTSLVEPLPIPGTLVRKRVSSDNVRMVPHKSLCPKGSVPVDTVTESAILQSLSDHRKRELKP
jgi:hypothetical protein